MMLRVICASIANPRIDDTGIQAIVSWSAAFNAKEDITGVLAFDGTRIIQIIEGPSAMVMKLFDSITIDSRHHGVIELVHVDIADHTFERWGMVRRPMADVMMAIERLR